MTKEAIFLKIKDMIEDEIGGDVQLESTFEDDLYMDSMDITQLFLDVESKFGVEIDYHNRTRPTKICELVDLVDQQINNIKS